MKVTVKDCRSKDTPYLGFISVDDGKGGYLHASAEIYSSRVFFRNFISGNIGEYKFQADRHYDECGAMFIGRGRGKKPDSAYVAMKELIKRISNTDINLDDHEVKSTNRWGEKTYEFNTFEHGDKVLVENPLGCAFECEVKSIFTDEGAEYAEVELIGFGGFTREIPTSKIKMMQEV